ncbi:hypothetical protein [Alicyclobacillus sp.]|uniref:hypothetical protein n=1 Tax=Alicyclobacillus sp. TaxID=61169 RepID=UPI0025C338DD|nr:hypothetical protein [Alicyclobacillus sp.]MCL6518142.1 hypothetical protein [Alicyclobacillus sp.]
MATKVFYFFCHSCGGDTATYEHSGVCPYCRAGRRDFTLVGTAVDPAESQELQSKIAELRAQWAGRHGAAPVGAGSRRRRFGRR